MKKGVLGLETSLGLPPTSPTWKIQWSGKAGGTGTWRASVVRKAASAAQATVPKGNRLLLGPRGSGWDPNTHSPHPPQTLLRPPLPSWSVGGVPDLRRKAEGDADESFGVGDGAGGPATGIRMAPILMSGTIQSGSKHNGGEFVVFKNVSSVTMDGKNGLTKMGSFESSLKGFFELVLALYRCPFGLIPVIYANPN